jgi:hypothetical protein
MMGDGHRERIRAMASKVDEYRAGAVRWERRAKKTRNQVDREWHMCLARAYLMLAEASAEGVCTEDRGTDTNFSKMENLRVLSNRCNALIDHRPSRGNVRAAHVR